MQLAWVDTSVYMLERALDPASIHGQVTRTALSIICQYHMSVSYVNVRSAVQAVQASLAAAVQHPRLCSMSHAGGCPPRQQWGGLPE